MAISLPSRVELTPCVILNRRPYRDTSLLVEAFAREYGRVGLVARGARRPRARWRGLLEPLQLVRLAWSGRGELHSLTNVDSGEARAVLTGESVYSGFYACELVLRVTARGDPHPDLFDALIACLTSLATDDQPAPALRLFERDVLAAIGYALPLRAESETGRAVEVQNHYHFHPHTGLRLAEDRPGPQDMLVSGADLLALAAGQIGHDRRGSALRRLLAAALAPHLGAQPLRSAQTLQALRRFRRPHASADGN